MKSALFFQCSSRDFIENVTARVYSLTPSHRFQFHVLSSFSIITYYLSLDEPGREGEGVDK